MAADLTETPQPQCGYNILSGDNAKEEITAIMEDCVWNEDYNHMKNFVLMVEGQFKCNKCNFKWSSYTATIEIDLINRCISKKYRQKCKRCENFWALPCIVSEEFKSIFRQVIQGCVETEETGQPVSINRDEPSTSDHTVAYCEKCQELGEPCFLGGTRPVQATVTFSDSKSAATSIFRQIPHAMASYVQKHLNLLDQSLEGMCVQPVVHINDESSFIHMLPTKGSNAIADWNKICENKLDNFLRGLDYQSLSLQSGLLPKLQKIINEITSDMSVHVEEQAVFQIAGKSEEVEETLKLVKKCIYKKPCIVPF